MMHAHPPGPGFPEQAPSLQHRTGSLDRGSFSFSFSSEDVRMVMVASGFLRQKKMTTFPVLGEEFCVVGTIGVQVEQGRIVFHFVYFIPSKRAVTVRNFAAISMLA
jgi:hypothetical protein